eukprot:938207_1
MQQEKYVLITLAVVDRLDIGAQISSCAGLFGASIFKAAGLSSLSIPNVVFNSTCFGLLAASGMIAYKFPSIDDDGFEDRVFRLKRNSVQNTVDLGSYVGAGLGFLGNRNLYSNFGGSALMQSVRMSTVGCALGVIFSVAALRGGIIDEHSFRKMGI